MKIALFVDNTLSVPLQTVINGLNGICKSVQFCEGKERLHIRDSFISYPTTYKKLTKSLLHEVSQSDIAVLATTIPYDNNFFFESDGRTVIVSFFGWNQLTDLRITNGFVYFSASLILDQLEIGQSHYP